MSAPDGISAGASAIPCDHRWSGDKEDAEYEGARVRVEATLAKARIRLRIDIGFGDAIVPATVGLEYPTLLDLPATHLLHELHQLRVAIDHVVLHLIRCDLGKEPPRALDLAVLDLP